MSQTCASSRPAAAAEPAKTGYGICGDFNGFTSSSNIFDSFLSLFSKGEASERLLAGATPPAAAVTKAGAGGDNSLGALAAKTMGRLASEARKTHLLFAPAEKDIEAGASDGFCLLSVTVRKPLTPLKIAAMAYSFMPFLLFVTLLLAAALTRAPYAAYAALVLGLTAALNEQGLKRVIHEPRPAESLVESPGMPSSHCVVAYTFLSWLLLESLCSAGVYVQPVCGAAAALAAFAPMPWARVYLKDHSEKQCAVGCIAGAAWGVCVFLLRCCLLPH